MGGVEAEAADAARYTNGSFRSTSHKYIDF